MTSQPVRKPSLIFLVGYRGSGKTTVGRLVANRLEWSFLDADTLIEERAGKTIREIFAAEGEAGFRDLESQILKEVCTRSKTVIATGGGIVLRDDNRARLRDSGLVVWLSADSRTLWDRIQSDPTTAARRPNLAGGGLSEVADLLAMREPLYRACADMEVAVAHVSPEQAADAILAAWTSHLPKLSG